MLPPKQKAVYDFIKKFQVEHGFGPTLDEIATKLKKTVPTIHQHVQALRAKGFLKQVGVVARSISTFDSNEEVSEIPLLGYVSAGSGIENIENPETIKVQNSMISPQGAHFALIVKGTSMIEDGIFPEDIIVVKRQNFADNGDVVVALTGSQDRALATVKRFYNQGDKIELRPKNPILPSVFYDPGQIEIRGKFVGLIRRA